MRSLKLIGLGLASCLPLLAFAASIAPLLGERALREECSIGSQAEMQECLAGKARESQKTLGQVEAESAARLAAWDEDPKYVSQAVARLTASGKEFARYREAHCRLLASLSGGGAGNAREIRRLACVAELDRQRAEQLRDALSDLPLTLK